MIIKSSFISRSSGQRLEIQYEELDSFDSIRHLPISAAGALCFCGDKLVLAYAHKKNVWEMPGGSLERGESFEEGIIREIKEETNMKVLELFPLGYDTVLNPLNGEMGITKLPLFAKQKNPHTAGFFNLSSYILRIDLSFGSSNPTITSPPASMTGTPI